MNWTGGCHRRRPQGGCVHGRAGRWFVMVVVRPCVLDKPSKEVCVQQLSGAVPDGRRSSCLSQSRSCPQAPRLGFLSSSPRVLATRLWPTESEPLAPRLPWSQPRLAC